MFIKRAHIVSSEFFSTKEELKNLNWSDIVRSGRNFNSPFIDAFEWDPEHFLYYRCRAITANVVNLNGDLFPDEELQKSYHTFIGKGIYYNHNSDHPDKAFGIILDAMYHQYPDDKYVQILGAIDKEDIERKYPNLLGRIVSGSLKTTSMSVAVQKCVCSVCGNVALTAEQLCDHMNPKSANYVKGRMYRGLKAHEINYGLNFLEDSLVESPADSTAYVFQIYASRDKNKSSRLMEHFHKYASLKQEFLKQSDKISDDLEQVVDDTVDKKIKNKVLQLVDEKVRIKIDPILQNIEKKTKEVIDDVVDSVIKQKETNIGLESVLLKDDKKEEKNEKKEVKSVEPKNPISTPPNLLKEEKKPTLENKETSDYQIPKSSSSIPEVRKSFLQLKADTKIPVSKTESLELIDKLFKETEESARKLKEKSESIALGEGLTINKVDSKHYEVFKNGISTGIKVEVSVDFYKKNTDEQKKEILEKFDVIRKSLEKSKKEVKYSMNITYEKGVDFDSSFFVISENDQQFKVSASEIIPTDIQERIKQNDENLVSSDEIVDQLRQMSAGRYDVLVNEVIPQLKKACAERNESIKKDASKMTKKAEFAWAEDEIPSKKVVKPSEGPEMAMNTDEGMKPEVSATQPSKIKQYYSKLPTKGVDEPINSINVQSSKDISDLEIKAKLDLLKKALEEEKKKNMELSKELSMEKEKGEKRDKTDSINKIIDLMSDLFDITEESKTKIVELLNKFAPIQLNLVKQLVELLGSKKAEKGIDELAQKSLEKDLPMPSMGKPLSKPVEPSMNKKEASQMPQIFLNTNETEFDMIDVAIKSLMK